MFWGRRNGKESSKGEAERLTQIDNRAIDGFTDQREVEWAKLSKFEVRRRKEREESSVQISILLQSSEVVEIEGSE